MDQSLLQRKFQMVLGIDASNIRAGGGLAHLVELLRHADPAHFHFSKVIVWSRSATLSKIEDRAWLVKEPHRLLEKGLPLSIIWQKFVLKKAIEKHSCSVVFTTCATYIDFLPTVSMCQNLLPFESEEANRYGISWLRLRLFILTLTQGQSFRNSHGVIFLSEYSKNRVDRRLRLNGSTGPVIPHGVNEMFFKGVARKREGPTGQKTITYVSIIDEYKHQWQVAQAVIDLVKDGYNLKLKLIGPSYPPALKKLKQVLNQGKENEEIVEWAGAISYEKLPDVYASSDIILFASTCETFGMILLESMASGRPIACSNRSSMPEILGDAGVYFDPLVVSSIKDAIRYLYCNEKAAEELGRLGRQRARDYSWKKCADSTFNYLAKTASEVVV
jgi:glycosyltransferase involved in cell wall biosynthesis